MSSGDAEKLGQRANSMNNAYKLKLDKIKSSKTNNPPAPNK